MNFQQNYTFHEDFDGHQAMVQPFGNHNGNRNGDRTQFGLVESTTGHYGTATSAVSHQRSNTAASPYNVENTPSLATATHFNLLGSGNQAYTSLYEAHVGLKHRYEAQKELVSELKGDLARLRQQALEQPAKSRREHSGSDSEFQSRPAIGNLAVPSTPPTLKQDDYPNVTYWTKEEWDDFVEREKLTNKNPLWNAFLTDANGKALSKQRYNEIWADAKLAFNSLYFRRLDPTSWSKKTDIVAAYFYNTITMKYPEFQLCDGNWKVHLWTTERYPDWVKNVRKPGGLQRAVPSIVTVGQKRPAPTSQTVMKTSKKPRQVKKEDIKLEIPPVQLTATKISIEEPIVIDDESDEDSIYVPKSATTSSAAPPTTSSAAPPTSTKPHVMEKVRDSSPAAPEHTATTTTTSSSNQTLPPAMVSAATSVSHPQEHQPATSTNIQPCISRAVASTAALTPQIPVPLPISPLITAVQQRLPSVQAAQSTPFESDEAPEPGILPMARPTRQKKLNPLANLMVPKATIETPEIVNTTPSPSTSDMIPELAPVKKGKPLVPSDSLLTARNLYMRDYAKEHPDATLDTFRVAFTKLDPKTRQAYETRSKELKAAAKATSASSEGLW
ncbi:hypothetical protein BDZ97DRAFT_1799301 [Flammula alnicola]|nr:hypothetical protein BDZ97DRAFT_1799301 [Flammula alnicola]